MRARYALVGSLFGVVGCDAAGRVAPADETRAAIAASPPTASSATGSPATVPVVVELFSSEGCSSCPPADAWLAELDRAQGIDGVTVIALEEHVDYWDYLGWKDPFSSAASSARQGEYAAALGERGVYTPEVLVDGHAVVQWSDPAGAARVLRAAAAERRAEVTVQRIGEQIVVEVTRVPSAAGDDETDVWLASTEPGLATEVPRGENAGKRLAHAPVVRSLRRLGRIASGTFRATVPTAANAATTRAVAFVQRAKSRRIVGAGSG